MAKELPVVCSLEAGDLQQRLAEIAAIGRASLIEHRAHDGTHVLRFRGSPETQRKLEEIVAAEQQCCAFLGLALNEDGDDLVLSITAPEAGQLTADGLAAAFQATDAA